MTDQACLRLCLAVWTATAVGAPSGTEAAKPLVLKTSHGRELVYAFASLPIAKSSGKSHRSLGLNTFLYRARTVGDFVSFTFYVPEAGDYDVLVSTFDYNGRATVSVELDDQKLGTMDMYAEKAYLHPPRPVGRLKLGRGKHTITFRVTGRHAKSSNCNIALDELRLRPAQ